MPDINSLHPFWVTSKELITSYILKGQQTSEDQLHSYKTLVLDRPDISVRYT